MRPLLAPLVLLIGIAAAVGSVPDQLGAQQPATHLEEQTVNEVAAQLRCVVCQNLSVADSPSEMAGQMRAVIRERLAAGDRPDEVVQYFVDKYGDWILLSPRRQGFTLLVWIAPLVAVVAGLGVAVVLIRRWSRRAATTETPPGVDPATSARIRREMETDS